MSTEATRLFDELNRRYFRRRLRGYRVRLDSRVILKDRAGECDLEKRIIRLDPTLLYSDSEGRAVLLHEMIHAYCWEYLPPDGDMHGLQFCRELKRLIRRGEQCLQHHLNDLLSLDGSFPHRMLDDLLAEIQRALKVQARTAHRRRWQTIWRDLQTRPEWPSWWRDWERGWVRRGSHYALQSVLLAWFREKWRDVCEQERLLRRRAQIFGLDVEKLRG